MNHETEEWVRLAKTPETRARIRRWARREHIATRFMIAELIAVFIWPVAGSVHSVWTSLRGEDQSFAPWGWLFGGLIALLTVTALLWSFARDKREEAMYADGRVALGRVDEVITHPQNDDGINAHSLKVSAELPGSVTIRREIQRDNELNAPERWEGKAVRFRHNTLDPDDLHDVLFIEFAEADKAAGS